MKNLKIYSLIVGMTFSTFACDDDISRFNEDPKNPVVVPAEPLFLSGLYNFAKQMVNIDYNHNIDRLWANYLTQTTYTQEANYDAANRDIGGTMWDNIYTETLYELKEAKEIIAEEDPTVALDPEMAAKTKANKLATITVLEVYSYQYLVDNYGDVPYSEALDINNITPAYDDASDIYDAIAADLQDAISNIDPTAPGFDASADLLYGGDMAKWEKFANSLLLKIGLRLADVNNTKASELVNDAVDGGVFESNEDNAVFEFITTQPYTNPVYEYFYVQNRNTDFVVTQNFIDMLDNFSDPRMDVYFDDNIPSGYVGGIYGANGNAFSDLTHPHPAITEPDYPGTIMDYASVSFGMAEAAERGYIGGSPADYYEDAIRASFDTWGLSTTQADVYLALPSVNYATAAGNYREKIGVQKYIALYNQGHEAWTEARRLDYPQLQTAVFSGVPNPKRMIYPVSEVLINNTNYEAAKTSMGGDDTSKPIFWDVN